MASMETPVQEVAPETQTGSAPSSEGRIFSVCVVVIYLVLGIAAFGCCSRGAHSVSSAHPSTC